MRFSVIVPVYNRPDDIKRLLQSFEGQESDIYEIIIIEDGSTTTSEKVIEEYKSTLPIKYFTKQNGGQGFARNYGMERATGDYFIILDSDAYVVENYFKYVKKEINKGELDAFGGPDAQQPEAGWKERAFDYCMTSWLTTGGTRNGVRNVQKKYFPRSFNMGFSKKVFETVGGFNWTNKGEDLEFSFRIIAHGFKIGLIPEALVYHRRKKNLKGFYKQLHFFGRSRVNVTRMFPNTFKLLHLLPLFWSVVFTISITVSLLTFTFHPFLWLFIFYFLLNFILSSLIKKDVRTGMLVIPSIIALFFGYSFGMISEWVKI